MGQQDRGGVRLETSDGLGLAGLANHIHRLIQRERGLIGLLVCEVRMFLIIKMKVKGLYKSENKVGVIGSLIYSRHEYILRTQERQVIRERMKIMDGR